jgi:CRP/FNR family transcriptional regulator, cyclic AMP receptor protein
MLKTENGIGEQLPEISLNPGPWRPPEGDDEFGYMLVAGLLLRRVTLGRGCSVELLGSDDVLLPWREECASFSRSEWQVVDRTRLAVLDLRPGSPLSRSPAAATFIANRAIDRSRMLSLQSAIMSIVGVEERLRALLWALAERWGAVVAEGVELEVNVPQSVLAEMVGARRPTVSQALGALCDRGHLVAVEQGRWVLLGDPPSAPAE